MSKLESELAKMKVGAIEIVARRHGLRFNGNHITELVLSGMTPEAVLDKLKNEQGVLLGIFRIFKRFW
jgi:hypothetical protein